MKAVVRYIDKKESVFPKLMISEGKNVVLFEEPGCGVLLSSNIAIEALGYSSECWDMSHFLDFNGSITLSND